MRILYICHRFPFPPARGGKIRPFNMIKHLGRKHDVVVASLVRSLEGLAIYPLTAGLPELREAIAGWLSRRYSIPQPDPATLLEGVYATPEDLDTPHHK